MTAPRPQATFDMSTIADHPKGAYVEITMGNLRQQVIITMKALVGSSRPDRIAGRTPAQMFRVQPSTFFDQLSRVTEEEMRWPIPLTWN